MTYARIAAELPVAAVGGSLRSQRRLNRAFGGVTWSRLGWRTMEGNVGGWMRNEFTAVVERDGRWHIAYCPEIPGANGQGRTKAAALKNLANAIALILDDRRRDGLRGIPASARRETIVVG